MKKSLIIIVAVLFLLVLTGCLQIETTVTVNTDGSGTVERIFMMQNEILAMLASMGSMGEEGESEEFKLLNEEELRAEAAGMGEGVVLVSAKPYETETFSGYKAVFSYPDINKLMVNQNPAESVPDGASDGGDAIQEMITFSFKKGNPATLKINLPKDVYEETGSEESGGQAEPSSEDMEMMKQIYGTMKMSMHVQVNGAVKKSNAAHRDGSRITLMEMDFGQVVQNEDKLKLLATQSGESIEGMKALLEGIPGIKVELQDTVEVIFR